MTNTMAEATTMLATWLARYREIDERSARGVAAAMRVEPEDKHDAKRIAQCTPVAEALLTAIGAIIPPPELVAKVREMREMREMAERGEVMWGPRDPAEERKLAERFYAETCVEFVEAMLAQLEEKP